MYEASIASIDFEIGAILDALEERALLDSTLVILTADHGEQMGEHGLFDHMQSLYQPLTHVPLLFRLPGARRGGASVGTPVSLVDLSATVLDLVGAEAGSWPGHSLRGTWSPETVEATTISPAMSQLARGLVEQPWYPIASGLEMQAVVHGSHHYICNPDGTEELYDLSRDPDESMNLVGVVAASLKIQTLRDAVAPVGAPPQWCPPPATETPRPPDRRR